MGVEVGADGGAADRKLEQAGQRAFDRRDPVVELGDPARDELAHGERRRVLEVRPKALFRMLSAQDVGVH